MALLLEATESDPRLSVSVRDNDGEFLVIEAAGALPAEMEAWLEPDTSKNRIWLRRGHLHIISRTPSSAGAAGATADARVCANCQRREGATKTCSRCGQTTYCSRDCQKAHWEAGHAKECVKKPKGSKREKRRALGLRQALAWLRESGSAGPGPAGAVPTLAPAAVDKMVLQRIKGAHRTVAENRHRARCLLAGSMLPSVLTCRMLPIEP